MSAGASTTLGHLTLSSGVKYTAIDQIKPPSQRWIYEPADVAAPGGAAMYTHYFSLNTPVNAPEAGQCGRFSYTALHVSDSASTGLPGDPATSLGTSFPGCCATRAQLSSQEMALEFMLFDLSACVAPSPLTIDAPPSLPPFPPPPAPSSPPSAPTPAPPPAPPPPPVPTHSAAIPAP
jgi:hypothetical protein